MKVNNFNPYENIVIFLIDGIGDLLMSIPALSALTNNFPYKITLICQSGINCWFFNNLPFKKIITIQVNSSSGKATFFQIDQVINEIKHCDLFFSFSTWISNEILNLINQLQVKKSIGFFEEFDIHIKLNDPKKNAIDAYFEFSKIFLADLNIIDYAQPPLLSIEAIKTAFLFKTKVLNAKKTLIVHPETKKEKQWSPENFNTVINHFLDLHPEFIALVLGQQDQKIDYGKHEKRIISCFGLDFEISCALVSQANFFLGVDSCMLHVADLFRIPSIGLFGPTNYAIFGVRFAQHEHIDGKGSMDNISVSTVLEKIDLFFELNLQGVKNK